MNSKKQKKILLIGLGSEIGSTLLSINNFKKGPLRITTVLTNSIHNNDLEKNLESLKTRLIINDPSLINLIKIEKSKSIILINNSPIKIYFGDIKKFNLKNFSKKFDATIVATSKSHINNKKLMNRFLKISKFVFGVAESNELPSIYPNLLGVTSNIIDIKSHKVSNFKNKSFALGSCQSNGWQAQLRALIDMFANLRVNYFKMLGCELDIVHPDTPQGRLGTKSLDPREQDARNNLRPGFSQVGQSMKKLFSIKHLINTISLRTLIMPPGYQISRFFFSYSLKNKKRLTKNLIINSIKKLSLKNRKKYQFTETTLGSRAFEKSEASAVILLNKKYFHFNDNLFNINYGNDKQRVSEMIFQAYVHNTRGYCFSVLNALEQILLNNNRTSFWK